MIVFHKIILFLVALCILNQSIDFDYMTFGSVANHKEADYDDVDCLLEFVVETLTGDDNFTAETNDDSGMAQNKALEKQNNSPQYSEQFRKVPVSPALKNTRSWQTGLDQSNNICKGFTKIIAPPPKA